MAEPNTGLAVGENKLGLDSDLFTRGGMETLAKERGETMVEKHAARVQIEKENMAIQQLAVLLPGLSNTLRVLALRESGYNVEEAARTLDEFRKEHEEQLKALQKRRGKVSKEAEAAERAAGSSGSDDSGSSSPSSSSGGDASSSSDSEGGGSKRKSRRSKGSKRSSRSKGDRKKRGSGRDSKGKRKKKRSSGRKEKKEKEKKDGGSSFGKYGILRELDYHQKRSEFILWALEVKKVDVETLPKPDERELFKDYMEDYNTGTLPHKKYYNLEAYDKYKMAKAARKGMSVSALGKRPANALALNDEEEMRRLRAEQMAKDRENRLMEAYQELKYTDKANDMKEQEMLRMQMQVAYRTGDIKTAERLKELLATEEEREKIRARKQ